MKKFWVWTIVLFASVCLIVPAFGQEKEIEDISEEVLTGPSDLNPEKILGPGGIGIQTHKDLLMSFGATVRLIPTQETNYDFGMSENVPGYFGTDVVKAFAGSALDTANAVQDVYKSSITLNNTILNNRGDSAVLSAYEDFANSFYTANEVTKNSASLNPTISALAASMSAINTTANDAINGIAVPVANPIADAAASAAAAAALQPGANLASISQAAFTAASATGSAVVAGITDPQQNAIASISATAAAQAAAAAAATTAGTTAGIAFQKALAAGMDQAAAAGAAMNAAEAAAKISANNAAAAAASDAAKAAVIKGGVTTPSEQLKGANLIQTSDALAAGMAQQVNHDDKDTAADLTQSIAYLNILKATADSFNPYYLADSFLKTHSNESGSVNDGYFRTETKLYFNAMPKDKKWSFYAALEYDKPIDTNTVDNRGGKDSSSSNFGLERLNASIELVDGLRLHGGWDIWGMDIIEAASMVYGDDNPGFWLNGKFKPIDFSIAWLKLEDNDFQNSAADHSNATDADRDLIAGYMDYKFRDTDKVRFFYGFDRIRSVPSLDLTAAIAAQAGLQDYAGIYGNNGIAGASATSPDIDAHTIGAYYLGNFNIIELMLEGAYKFGSAEDTGLKGVDNGVSTIAYDDFDISAYAFSADIGFELKDMVGWLSLKPHMGFMYTSGDDDAKDDKLSGYTGITSGQRFSRMWGGENTIIGDANLVLGTGLYGYIPELYGNGTPVFTGGIQNMAGNGNGRGDNPGLTMYSLGFTLRPKIYLIYRTNANIFYWNEDFSVANMVNPVTTNSSGLVKQRYTKVEAGYVGTEWDNEITLALSKNMFIKTQASLFFPGEAVEDVTAALSGGQASDDIASRLAMELIWNF